MVTCKHRWYISTHPRTQNSRDIDDLGDEIEVCKEEIKQIDDTCLGAKQAMEANTRKKHLAALQVTS